MNTAKRDKKPLNNDLRETVQVFCRLRPLQDECELPSIKLISSTTLATSTEYKSKSVRRDCNYVFRHVFTSYSSQKDVFKHVALPLLDDLISGKNGLLFTYGVTGSGKTFTLTGDPMNPGIMPSSIHTLFNSIGDKQAQKFLIKSDRMNGFEVQSENEAIEDRIKEAKINNKRLKTVKKISNDKIMYLNEDIVLSNVNPDCLYSIFISYFEIYNNVVYDLLDESSSKFIQSKIIREDYQKNMYVNGVEEVEVKSAEEAFELFHLGQKRKRMAHTLLNAESSRSHSVFNIRVVQLVKNMNGTEIPTQTLMKIGQLSLVDLAGSERCNRTNNTGIRLKEASSINNSLMTLRSCLEILRENQKSGVNKVVPYRDSRLTLLFKNYFDGEGQVRMIVCVNPSEQDCDENLQVLKFAEMTQEVQVVKAESRYMHQFKTPIKSASVQTPKTKSVLSSLGPKIPSIKLNLEDPNEMLASIDKLCKCLEVRKQKALIYKTDFEQKVGAFRKQLSSITDGSVLLKSEIKNLKAAIRKEKLLTENHNSRFTDLESRNFSLTTENQNLREVVQMLRMTRDEKNLKINQNCLEHEKQKQKLEMRNEKLNQELDNKLREQRRLLENEMHTKDLKLKKMKEIIDSDDVRIPLTPVEVHEKKFALQNVSDKPASCVIKPPRCKPDDVWLEHNSVKLVALNTVLQPSIRKRKSVPSLKKATDVTNSKQTKYCLIAEEANDARGVETKLYKGDIVPTCSGGAQVIFNGVECLREELPTTVPSSLKE